MRSTTSTARRGLTTRCWKKRVESEISRSKEEELVCTLARQERGGEGASVYNCLDFRHARIESFLCPWTLFDWCRGSPSSILVLSLQSILTECDRTGQS
jgi:hypothetical protein